MRGELNWYLGGLLLGAAFFAAVWLVKPIGVSTQYVIANGLLWKAVSPGVVTAKGDGSGAYVSENAYLNKSKGKYAANVAKPLNYGLLFVGGLLLGALLSVFTGGPRGSKEERVLPTVWRNRFGDRPLLRFSAAFAAGFIVLLGARLAGGCTSGHMMSGMMQTSVSGYLFAIGVFGTAIPLAILVYGRK